MNERQRAHITYFLERVEYWKGLRREYWAARMLAARDADRAHPLRSGAEGTEVFEPEVPASSHHYHSGANYRRRSARTGQQTL